MGLVDSNRSTDHRLERETRPIPFAHSRLRMTRRLNLVFVAVLLAATAAFGGGMHLVRGIQIRRNASTLLDRASRAEARHDIEKAEQSLTQYLKIKREDGPAWKWYARVVNQHESNPGQRDRVLLVHEQALRYNPGDLKLERRCADLAIELAKQKNEQSFYKDAERHLETLIEKLSRDSQSPPVAKELAELEDLLGQCDRELARFEEAEKWFLRAIKHDPGRVACYDRLARLGRLQRGRSARLRGNEADDGTIQEMVAKNPKVGLAYIYRWRYSQEFLAAAEASDIRKALELAPDDPEVLVTAAAASERKPDAAAARSYFEKGWKIDPKNLALALGLARLETRERHLDRGEAVLRQAYQANPSLTLAFELAENLILQDKVEGKGQAVDYITILRNAGLGDTLGRYLEAKILLRRQRWSEAIPKIRTARAILVLDPQLTFNLDLMLAECFGHLGLDDQRLDALRKAAKGDSSPESVRIELARALGRCGDLNEAIAILSPLVDRTPELRLDLARLLIQKTTRQPRGQRDWREAERYLRETEKALPQAVESLTLLRVDLLGAQDRLDDARSLLSSVLAKDAKNLEYRLALARLTQRQGNDAAGLQILDRTEEEFGPSLKIQLARLAHRGLHRDLEAKAGVARLAANRRQLPAADQPVFLDRLAAVEILLGEPSLAREHLLELAGLRPANVQVLMSLFDVALQTADHACALDMVTKIRTIEGEDGTLWRFAQAAYVLDEARRGVTKDLRPARALAEEIASKRPAWWGHFVLLAEIAELEGQTEQAIRNYTQAIELGNAQPTLARRLVGLLNQGNQFDRIDRVIEVLSDRGTSTADLVLSTALNAIRQQDYDRGIALARQVFSESSTNYSDHLFLGQFYLAAHRSIEAGKELRRAVELGPGVPITWVGYVQYLVLEKQIDQAKAAVAAAQKAIPSDRANLALAQCYAMVGETAEADARMKSVLSSPSCDLTAIRVAVDLYINQGRFDQVDPILDKLPSPAMSTTPDVLAWANRARSLARLSTGRLVEMDQALALIELNLKANPSNVEDQRLKAVVLALRTSRRGDAIRLLEPLDQSNQLGTNEQFVLAQSYLAERLVGKYRSQMTKLLDHGVKNPQHVAHFVEFLLNSRELDQADHWVAELRRLSPRSLGVLELEARLLDLRKRKPELLALLIERGRQFPDEMGSVAGLLELFGFAAEAEAACKAFIASKTDEPERALVLASFLARQDRTKESIALLEAAWKTCRPDAVAVTALALYVAPSADDNLKHRVEAWVAEAIRKSPSAAGSLRPKLATMYSRRGRYDEAEALFRQILVSDPDNVETLNNLAWELALREPGEPREALELIDRAIEKRGLISTFVDTRAVALIQAGDPDRAAQELRAAQVADPKNVSLALHLAWAYQSSGKVDAARNAFQVAEELGFRPEARHPLERGFIDRLRGQLAKN
jgi:cellulose synthase operon protein C